MGALRRGDGLTRCPGCGILRGESQMRTYDPDLRAWQWLMVCKSCQLSSHAKVNERACSTAAYFRGRASH